MNIKKIGIVIAAALVSLFADSLPAMADPPTAPSNVASKTHTPGISSTKKNIEVTWTASTDSDGDLKYYAVLWDNNAETRPVSPTHGASATSAPSGDLEDGEWYFHIIAGDNDGNRSDAVDIGPFIIDTVPNISSVTPISCVSGDSITITGTDFMSEAAAKIGDTSISIEFVSSTELRATVPAEISAGIYDITVTNTNGKSTPDTVTVTVYKPGDINGDNDVDLADVIVGLKVIAGDDVVVEIYLNRACTGKIGLAEVICIFGKI